MGVVEIFLPEIDYDTNDGVTIHSGIWQVVFTTWIHGGIISEVLKLRICAGDEDLIMSRKAGLIGTLRINGNFSLRT